MIHSTRPHSLDPRRHASVAAVIPARDEARAIASVVRGAARFVDAVIVVDDGSRDATGDLASRAGAAVLALSPRTGKGAALRAGLRAAFDAGHAAVVTLDGDGQHATDEIPRLLSAWARGADLVLGDRSAERCRMPPLRRATNRLLTLALRPWTGAAVRDSQCGFRCLSRELHERLRLTSSRFEIESEMLIEAARAGAILAQVPVSAVYAGEVSKIRPLADGCRFARLILLAAGRSIAAAVRSGFLPVPPRPCPGRQPQESR